MKCANTLSSSKAFRLSPSFHGSFRQTTSLASSTGLLRKRTKIDEEI